MKYADRDLTDQYIKESYQDVLQQYTGSSDRIWVLDGLGNALFSFPSSSIGGTITFSDPSGSFYVSQSYRTVSGSQNVLTTDSILYASASSANIILTMPTASSVSGRLFKIKKTDSSGFEIIITSSVNIDYGTELRLTQRGSSVTLHSDSTQYWIH